MRCWRTELAPAMSEQMSVGPSRISCMFDRSGGAGSGGGRHPRVARADRVTAIRRSELRIEAMVLRDAADWGWKHGVDLDDPFAIGPAGGVGKHVDLDGTPWIDERPARLPLVR